jgi:hypothetical protein
MVRRGGWLSRGLARAVFRRGPRSPESVVACGCSGSGKQPAPAAPTSPAFEPTAGGALHAGFVPYTTWVDGTVGCSLGTARWAAPHTRPS